MQEQIKSMQDAVIEAAPEVQDLESAPEPMAVDGDGPEPEMTGSNPTDSDGLAPQDEKDGKEFFGQKGSDQFYYLARTEGDLKITDSEDTVVMSAKEKGIGQSEEEVREFLINSARELDLDAVGMDILQHYNLLAPREEAAPDKLGEPKPAEEAPKDEAPKADEPPAEPAAEPAGEPKTGESEPPAEEAPKDEKSADEKEDKKKKKKDEEPNEARVAEAKVTADSGDNIEWPLKITITGEKEFNDTVKALAHFNYDTEEHEDHIRVMVEAPSLEAAVLTLKADLKQRGVVTEQITGVGESPAAGETRPQRAAGEASPTEPAAGQSTDQPTKESAEGLEEKKISASQAAQLAEELGEKYGAVRDADPAFGDIEFVFPSVPKEDLVGDLIKRFPDYDWQASGAKDSKEPNMVGRAFPYAIAGLYQGPGASNESKVKESAMNCPHCGKTINEEAKKESVPTGAPSPGAVHKADPKQPIQNEPQDGKLPKDAPPAPGVPSAKSGKTESVPATAPSPGQLKHPVDPKTPKTNAPQVGKVVPGGAAPGGVMTTVKKAQGASGKAVESKEEDDKKAKEKKEAEDKKNEGRVPADPTALDTEEDYIKALLEKLI